MRTLAPLVLSAALAATVVGASPAEAVRNNGCNYPPGSAHSVIRTSPDVLFAKAGSTVKLNGQTKAAGGKGCAGAFVSLIVSENGGAYHLYHPTARTNGINSGPNGYFTFTKRMSHTMRYYFTWSYARNSFVVSKIGKVYNP
jgi:hypothetical protein